MEQMFKVLMEEAVPINPETNDYTWAQIDKTTSSIDDIG